MLISVATANIKTRFDFVLAERAFTYRHCQRSQKKHRSGATLERLMWFLDANDDGELTPADRKLAFEKSDKDGDGMLSEKELVRSTANVLTAVCVDSASIDRECFEKGTDPEGKAFGSVWEILDVDGDKQLTMEEFWRLYGKMDSNDDQFISKRELITFYNRYEYVLCRPFREQVFSLLKSRDRIAKNPFFGFLDANHDFKVTMEDVSYALTKLDANMDGVISRAEFKGKTDRIF